MSRANTAVPGAPLAGMELVQKLVLTNFLIFVNFEESGSNKLLRLFLGLLISLVGLTLQLIAQPFRKRTDNATDARSTHVE